MVKSSQAWVCDLEVLKLVRFKKKNHPRKNSNPDGIKVDPVVIRV